jgi:hypothetical protein
MPNHITNIIIASQEVENALINGDEDVDFNRIVTMPDSLHVAGGRAEDLAKFVHQGSPRAGDAVDFWRALTTSGGLREMERGGLSSYKDEDFEEFIQILRNLRKHGHASWYDWSVANWGTKWNAYETQHNDHLQFDTAWSAPLPVIEKLVAMFPEETIEHKWADEDIGSNYGHRIYTKGGHFEEPAIADPILFALTVKGELDPDGNHECYRPNPDTGIWEYFDEDEEEEE